MPRHSLLFFSSNDDNIDPFLMLSTPYNTKSTGTTKQSQLANFQLNKKYKNIATSPQPVSLLDFVQNLDFRCQNKTSVQQKLPWWPRLIAKIEAWRVHHTSCSHGTVRNKGWGPQERERDAYAGASLNWPAHFVNGALPQLQWCQHQYKTQHCFWAWKFWILSRSDGHLVAFH